MRWDVRWACVYLLDDLALLEHLTHQRGQRRERLEVGPEGRFVHLLALLRQLERHHCESEHLRREGLGRSHANLGARMQVDARVRLA
jgi:hypothetical protein